MKYKILDSISTEGMQTQIDAYTKDGAYVVRFFGGDDKGYWALLERMYAGRNQEDE